MDSRSRARMASCGLRSLAILVAAVALATRLITAYFTSDVLPLPANTEVANPPLANRVLLVVLDGLRYDTALKTQIMPNLRQLAMHGASGLSMTGELTMTVNGVRCIGAGVNPTLSDYLQVRAVTFDNPFAALAARGGRIALVGTGTWQSQFGAYANIAVARDPSMDRAEFVDSVNGADRIYVEQALRIVRRNDWDLVVLHLPGIDMASHRWTAFAEPFRVKARAVDTDLGRLIDAAGSNTTIVITSDHGSGERGHHGSGEPEARRTPIILAGRGIAAGVRLSIRQIDIAATLAILFGLPIPASSEGWVMTSALDAPAAVRDRIVAANRAQLAHYARAYAAARAIPEPAFADDDPHAMSDWLSAVQSGATLVPALWAAVLAITAVLLIVGEWSGLSWRASVVWWILALLGGLAIGSTAPGLAVAGGALAVSLVAFWQEPRARRPRVVATVVGVLAVLESAMAMWRLHYRMVEILVDHVEGRLRTPSEVMAAVLVGVAVAIAARPLRSILRNGPPANGWRWTTLAVLFTLSAVGDVLALPAGIGAGILAALIVADRSHLPGAFILVGVAILAIACERLHALDHAALGVLAPLLCVALAATRARQLGRPALVALAAVATCAAVIRAAGVPPDLYRALLVVCGVGLWVLPICQPGAARVETLGYAALVMLSVFCRPAQVPGLLVIAFAAGVLGRLVARSERDDRAVLWATLFAISVRLGYFALFEHAFSLGKLELWLGFMGNSGGESFGAMIVELKFALAFTVALALVTAELARRVRWRVVGCCGAFLLLRVGHIVLSMTIARGTVHSPHADVAPVFLTLVMLATLVAFAVVLAAVGPRAGDERAV